MTGTTTFTFFEVFEDGTSLGCFFPDVAVFFTNGLGLGGGRRLPQASPGLFQLSSSYLVSEGTNVRALPVISCIHLGAREMTVGRSVDLL